MSFLREKKTSKSKFVNAGHTQRAVKEKEVWRLKCFQVVKAHFLLELVRYLNS